MAALQGSDPVLLLHDPDDNLTSSSWARENQLNKVEINYEDNEEGTSQPVDTSQLKRKTTGARRPKKVGPSIADRALWNAVAPNRPDIAIELGNTAIVVDSSPETSPEGPNRRNKSRTREERKIKEGDHEDEDGRKHWDLDDWSYREGLRLDRVKLARKRDEKQRQSEVKTASTALIPLLLENLDSRVKKPDHPSQQDDAVNVDEPSRTEENNTPGNSSAYPIDPRDHTNKLNGDTQILTSRPHIQDTSTPELESSAGPPSTQLSEFQPAAVPKFTNMATAFQSRPTPPKMPSPLQLGSRRRSRSPRGIRSPIYKVPHTATFPSNDPRSPHAYVKNLSRKLSFPGFRNQEPLLSAGLSTKSSSIWPSPQPTQSTFSTGGYHTRDTSRGSDHLAPLNWQNTTSPSTGQPSPASPPNHGHAGTVGMSLPGISSIHKILESDQRQQKQMEQHQMQRGMSMSSAPTPAHQFSQPSPASGYTMSPPSTTAGGGSPPSPAYVNSQGASPVTTFSHNNASNNIGSVGHAISLPSPPGFGKSPLPPQITFNRRASTALERIPTGFSTGSPSTRFPLSHSSATSPSDGQQAWSPGDGPSPLTNITTPSSDRGAVTRINTFPQAAAGGNVSIDDAMTTSPRAIEPSLRSSPPRPPILPGGSGPLSLPLPSPMPSLHGRNFSSGEADGMGAGAGIGAGIAVSGGMRIISGSQGGYKCTFPSCNAPPFQTQYLLK
jgi:hypothetical protein